MNLFDYLERHACDSFETEPVHDLDLLVFSQLVHAPLERLDGMRLGPKGAKLCTLVQDIWPACHAGADLRKIVGNERRRVWDFITPGSRYGEVRLNDFTCRKDESTSSDATQFAAALFTVGDIDIVAFRGTDSTIHGWREDFNMGLESPVPAQLLAANYPLAHCRRKSAIYICGHSKGGNLAVYSGVMCNPSLRSRIARVCSFDGPGVSDYVRSSNGWSEMEDRLVSVVPQDSVIGLLLGCEKQGRVVQSLDKGLLQHNPYVWLVEGDDFVDAKDLSFGSRVTGRACREFLSTCTIEQRRVLIETVFELLECVKVEKVTDLPKALKDNRSELNTKYRALPEDRRSLVGKLFASAVGSTFKSFGLEVMDSIGLKKKSNTEGKQ